VHTGIIVGHVPEYRSVRVHVLREYWCLPNFNGDVVMNHEHLCEGHCILIILWPKCKRSSDKFHRKIIPIGIRYGGNLCLIGWEGRWGLIYG
jgi:hypothetical protein